jgi:hypothetical protein
MIATFVDSFQRDKDVETNLVTLKRLACVALLSWDYAFGVTNCVENPNLVR